MLERKTVGLKLGFSHRVESHGLKEPKNNKNIHDNKDTDLKKHDRAVFVNESSRDLDNRWSQLDSVSETKHSDSNDHAQYDADDSNYVAQKMVVEHIDKEWSVLVCRW